jgi:uncharacterized iron-regulated protein
MRKTLSLALFFVLFLSVVAEGVGEPRKVLRVRDGKVIHFNQMVDDLKNVSAVFVGEVHDMPSHHRAQFSIIRALHESDTPMAVGLEMFRAENQHVLDSWVRATLSLEKFLPVYYDNWRLPWPLYRDIFEYAREHEVPLRGLNAPDGITRKIAARGFGSLSADEKKQLPPGISCTVDPKYMDFIRRAYGDHAHRAPNFVNFCEAQMVWDKTMAWHLEGYLRKNPDRTMVVLAGIGHAWKRGIPEHLGADSKLSYRVVLPLIPDRIDGKTVTIDDADYVMLD